MNRKWLFLLCTSFLISFAAEQTVSATPDSGRIAGRTRYETAAKISSTGWSKADTAILATGVNYPDALCAAPFAKLMGAPILLTEKGNLTKEAKDELQRLEVKKVYLIGGPGVLSTAIEDELKEMNIEYSRIAGEDRYDTSVQIAEEIVKVSPISEVVFATGTSFPDALSMAPVAAQKGMPILLTAKSIIPEKIRDFIKNTVITKSYTIGGTAAIDEGVLNSLPHSERVSGENRYATNVEVMKKFIETLDFTTTYAATGQSWPDALAGSALAPKTSSPIVLVGNQLSPITQSFLKNNRNWIKQLQVIGGTGVVNNRVPLVLLGQDPGVGVFNGSQLQVHFIDVGQADCFLIRSGNEAMLIDAGNNEDANLILAYLRIMGIKKLDVLVGTHPDEDHIGAMDSVIQSLNVEKVYMPNVASATRTFEDVLTALRAKNLQVNSPIPGNTFRLGDVLFTVLAPNGSGYEDDNNYSIVLKADYGNKAFLFTGDAEDISEREILAKGFNLASDVLKVGHHGSASSTTEEFLAAVNPKYAVISVGKNNTYGHPTATILNRLSSKEVTIYRTDQKGTIIAKSDGAVVNFSFILNTQQYTDTGNTGSQPSTPPAVNNKITASIDDTTPNQLQTIHLTVTGPAGTKVTAVPHYKTTSTTYNGVIDTNGKAVISIPIGRASKGYTVKVDVSVNVAGKITYTSASFTPQ